jgi:hypothetical protein
MSQDVVASFARHRQAVLVEQETQFPANSPAMIGEASAADLLGAAAFAHGVDELDAIRVDDTEDRGSPQEGPCPVLMGREEAKSRVRSGRRGNNGR